MSKLVDAFLAAQNSIGKPGETMAAVATEFPSLVQVLVGTLAPDGTVQTWPATVMLFHEDDGIKFCINPKSGNRVFFGKLSDATKGFEGLEYELREGRFESKPRGRKSLS